LLHQVKRIFLAILVLAIAWVGQRIYNNPPSALPLPYDLAMITEAELSKASKANVLIVGDRLGINLNRYLEEALAPLSKKLREPLRVVNWAVDGESMAMTAHKLRSLKTYPEVIVYHGGTQEFFQDRFDLKDAKRIHTNIARYNNDFWQSILILAPFLGRALYHPVTRFPIELSPSPNRKIYEAFEKQQQADLSYQLLTIEWRSALHRIREHNAQIIVVAPPLNLEIAPKRVCENSSSPAVVSEQKAIEELLEAGDPKSALSRAVKLAELTTANSQSFYLLGRAHSSLGEYPQAKAAFYRAQFFDCDLSRGNLLINKILIEEAERANQQVIDMNRLVNNHMGKNVLFFDEYKAQGIFYEEVAHQIEQLAKNILKM
jgi:tetratricopeptide (TPR) repeat protein